MKYLIKTAAILLTLAFLAAPAAHAGEAGDINPKKGGSNGVVIMIVDRF